MKANAGAFIPRLKTGAFLRLIRKKEHRVISKKIRDDSHRHGPSAYCPLSIICVE